MNPPVTLIAKGVPKKNSFGENLLPAIQLIRIMAKKVPIKKSTYFFTFRHSKIILANGVPKKILLEKIYSPPSKPRRKCVT